MKKRIFALALALMLTFAMTAPAMAEDYTEPGDGTSTMTYKVASSYTVSIPSTVNISTESKTGTLSVSVLAGAVIPFGESIFVKLTTCDFKLTNNNDEIAYTINTDLAQGATVLTHAAGKADATMVELALAIAEGAAPKYAGDYTDTITFTVSVGAPGN